MNIKDAYKNLYSSDIKSIEKNLNNLIKLKKQKARRSNSQPEELEMQ